MINERIAKYRLANSAAVARQWYSKFIATFDNSKNWFEKSWNAVEMDGFIDDFTAGIKLRTATRSNGQSNPPNAIDLIRAIYFCKYYPFTNVFHHNCHKHSSIEMMNDDLETKYNLDIYLNVKNSSPIRLQLSIFRSIPLH